MTPLDISIVGPGRAGTSLAVAAVRAGHRIAFMVGRDQERAAAAALMVDASPAVIGDPLGEGDLVVIAVRDSAIAEVATALASSASGYPAAVHVSGFTSVSALDPLVEVGLVVGSFHPLQSLPTADAGAGQIERAHVAVTARPPLRAMLHELADTLGALAFDLEDERKPLYHAAAAAAANFPVAALAMADDLFAAAGVPFAAARPLVEAVVDNAFTLGPRAALTGPVVRGDAETVAGQLRAVHQAAPEWLPGFVASVRELARLTGRGDNFMELLERWRDEEQT